MNRVDANSLVELVALYFLQSKPVCEVKNINLFIKYRETTEKNEYFVKKIYILCDGFVLNPSSCPTPNRFLYRQ